MKSAVASLRFFLVLFGAFIAYSVILISYRNSLEPSVVGWLFAGVFSLGIGCALETTRRKGSAFARIVSNVCALTSWLGICSVFALRWSHSLVISLDASGRSINTLFWVLSIVFVAALFLPPIIFSCRMVRPEVR